MNPLYTFPMRPRELVVPVLFSALVLAACGPDKNTTADDETTTSPPVTASTTDPATTTSTTSTSTTGPTTDEFTTGKIPCDQPEPVDCICAPGCGARVWC